MLEVIRAVLEQMQQSEVHISLKFFWELTDVVFFCFFPPEERKWDTAGISLLTC